MQIERMRHDGRADDSDGEREGRSITQFGDNGVKERGAPVRRRDYELTQIAEADDADEGGDHQFEWTEAFLVELQDCKGYDSGNGQTARQRDVKQQGDPKGTAEEFRNVSRHRGDFR